jgi:hypothetical protein
MRPIILLLLLVFVAAGTCLPCRCLATIRGIHTDWWKEFITKAIEMVSGAPIYMPSFMNSGSGLQKLIREYTDSKVIS